MLQKQYTQNLIGIGSSQKARRWHPQCTHGAIDEVHDDGIMQAERKLKAWRK